MSRIGRLPVRIPKGVKVTIKEGQVLIESSKGKVVQKIIGATNWTDGSMVNAVKSFL